MGRINSGGGGGGVIFPPQLVQRTTIAADVRSVGAQPRAATNLELELPLATCCVNNIPG